MKRVAVLASGSGSNFEALVTGVDPRLARVALLVCNVPTAGVVERASALHVPAAVLDHRATPDRASYDALVVERLQAEGIDLVCLAGYMRLVTPGFLRAFPDRVLNIHPALLPSFKGLHAVRQSLAAGVKVTGCTVHVVDEGTDTGPIIAQAAVPVLPGDDEATLAERIHHEEHRLYPAVVNAWARGEVTVDGQAVHVSRWI